MRLARAIAFVIGIAFGATITLTAWWARHRPQTSIHADPRAAVAPTYPTIHQAILEREKRGPVGVLFLGDSITEFWETVPWLWQEKFGQYDPCNGGVIFDQIQHVLWRIENGELDGIHPRVIVIQIGTNNLSIGHDDPYEVAAGIADLIRFVRGRSDAKILLLGLFPRHDRFSPLIAKTNELLPGMVQGGVKDGSIVYLDIGSQIPAEDFPDGLHPNPDGFRSWADAILPTLQSLYKGHPTTQKTDRDSN